MGISIGGGRSGAVHGEARGWRAFLFGGIFAFVGLAATVALSVFFLKNLETYRWEKTPATLQHCEVEVIGGEDSPPEEPFRMQVAFEYTRGSEVYRSTRFAFSEGNERSYEKLSLARMRLLAQQPLLCYVNPADPTQAVLKRGSLWVGLMLLLPLVFVAIGVGVILGALGESKDRGNVGEAGGSISAKARKGKAMPAAAAFAIFAVLAAVGLGTLIAFAKTTLAGAAASKSWAEVPCQIIWSRVLTHEGDDGDTYSVDIFYRYEYNGVEHRSNRHSFSFGSSSGRAAKSRVVERYPRGSKRTCYVNPKQPEQAVLRPGLSAFALIGLIPLAMFAGGATGMGAMAKKIARGRGLAGDESGDPRRAGFPRAAGERSNAAMELKPHTSRTTAALVMLFVVVFWNGIVSIFLFEVAEGWKSGRPDWFQALFLVPFVLVGAALVAGFVYSFLAIFNPKPVLRLSPGTVRLGEPARLEWEMRGASSRIKRFRIWILGVEAATFRRGTDTVTEEETFYCEELTGTSHAREMVRGSAGLSLPHDSMCTFDAGNNRVVWRLMIEGEIGIWPDIVDCHEVTVAGPDPRAAGRNASAGAGA